MEHLLLFLIVFAMGYAAGYAVSWISHIKRVLQYHQEAEKVVDEAAFTEITIEQHNDAYFIYIKETGKFLAQGSTLNDALETIRNLYPDESFKGTMSEKDAKQAKLFN